MASTLTITFGESTDVLINTDLNVGINIGAFAGGFKVLNNLETFRVSRTRNGISEYPNPYTDASVAENYSNAWNLDYQYNSGNSVLPASFSGNTVTITLLNIFWQFDTITGSSIDNGSVTYSISNDLPTISQNVNINGYSRSLGNECVKCLVELICTGGTQFYNVYINENLQLSNQTSPINATIDRSVFNRIRITDSENTLIGNQISFANRKVENKDITTVISNSLGGSTINVSVAFISSSVSPYQYSLNGTSYQTSNVFTGQAPGNYNVYVKDNFDCITSNQIVIDGSTTLTETVFDISNINALRFAKYDLGKKNQNNTLSNNDLRLTSYTYLQKYLENDVVTTQFKTNAQYINCFYLDKDKSTTELIEIKRTNNIGLKQKSTSTYFDLENGKSGIYFGVVNLLDYDTESFLETVNYGFALPQWANTQDSLVTIDGIGQVKIDNIIYSETYNSFVLEFNIAYTGNPITNKTISAQYNLQPYEIYEFDTTIIKDGNVIIEVGAASDSINFTYISECIKMVEDSEFLFDITYWDDENKGNMNYQTNIKHKLRLNGYQDDIGEQETEGYNGDKEFYVTDNVIYDVQKFTFKQLSTQMANKLRMVVAHGYLLINGLYYKLSEVPEVSGDGNYNLKTFSVSLKQGGERFLTDEQEIITNTSQGQEIGIALASAQGKGILAWTKNY
tara:strand:- start:2366 stop:4408 length:2043 start_codon:yes stop_codon:yes gene_type:complete